MVSSVRPFSEPPAAPASSVAPPGMLAAAPTPPVALASATPAPAAPKPRAPLPPSVNAAVTAHKLEDGKVSSAPGVLVLSCFSANCLLFFFPTEQTLYECGGEWVEADKLNKEVLRRYAEKMVAQEAAPLQSKKLKKQATAAADCSRCGEAGHASDECEDDEPRKDKGEKDDEEYASDASEALLSSSSSISLESEEEEAPEAAAGKARPRKQRRGGRRGGRADKGEPDARTLLSQKGQKDKRRDHTVVPRGTALQHLLATSRIETLVAGTLARVVHEPNGDAAVLRPLLLLPVAKDGRGGEGGKQAELRAAVEDEDEEADAARLVRQRKRKERAHRQARKRHEMRRATQQQPQQSEPEERGPDGDGPRAGQRHRRPRRRLLRRRALLPILAHVALPLQRVLAAHHPHAALRRHVDEVALRAQDQLLSSAPREKPDTRKKPLAWNESCSRWCWSDGVLPSSYAPPSSRSRGLSRPPPTGRMGEAAEGGARAAAAAGCRAFSGAAARSRSRPTSCCLVELHPITACRFPNCQLLIRVVHSAAASGGSNLLPCTMSTSGPGTMPSGFGVQCAACQTERALVTTRRNWRLAAASSGTASCGVASVSHTISPLPTDLHRDCPQERSIKDRMCSSSPSRPIIPGSVMRQLNTRHEPLTREKQRKSGAIATLTQCCWP